MLNTPKRVPDPKAPAISQALDLLAVLGKGNKKHKEILEEMLAVQTHNEKLFTDATELKVKAEKAIKDAEVAQDRLDGNKITLENKISKEKENLKQSVVKFQNDVTNKNEQFRVREQELETKKAALKSAQDELNKQESILKAREDNIVDAESKLTFKREAFAEKENKVDTMLSQLRAIILK